VLSEPDRLSPVPAHQADILTRMGVTIAGRPSTADLIIDALIGDQRSIPDILQAAIRNETTAQTGQTVLTIADTG
jgi:hypothetical protein